MPRGVRGSKESKEERLRKARERNSRNRERDPEAWRKKEKAYRDARRSKDPEGWKKYDRKYNTPERKMKAWKADLKRKYGITPEDYERMLSFQNKCCAICLTSDPSKAAPHGKSVYFCVDHDHSTGAIRGLLCFQCNLAIGMLETTANTDRAARYLKDADARAPKDMVVQIS